MKQGQTQQKRETKMLDAMNERKISRPAERKAKE